MISIDGINSFLNYIFIKIIFPYRGIIYSVINNGIKVTFKLLVFFFLYMAIFMFSKIFTGSAKRYHDIFTNSTYNVLAVSL